MHQQCMPIDLDHLRLGTSLINDSKHLGDMRLSSCSARRWLEGQHVGCFDKGLLGRSSTVCCSSGHERRLTFTGSDELAFGIFPTWIRQHQGLCRQFPSACFSCKAEMMEDGDQKGAVGTNPIHSSSSADQEDKTQNSASALPGFIYPSAKSVGKSTNIVWQKCMVSREEREKLLQQRGCVIWITGLSGSGKSTLACTLDHQLYKRGHLSYVLDGDNLRHGLNKNLGFSAEDRAENIRRIGEVARIFVDAGVICIASAISPYRKDRDSCRELLQPGEFIEVYMNFPLKLCEERDPKGLYKLARAGKIKGFTGVDDPYEAPINCEMVLEPIEGRCPTPTEMATKLLSYLEEKGFLGSSCRN